MLICSFVSLPVYVPQAQADGLTLPAPGTMVHLSGAFNPPVLKGIRVHPENPFRFDFILDKGDAHLRGNDNPLRQESTKLIKYFLASLTIPEKDLWVNLSPYEKDRIAPDAFGLTEMGRDLLAQDYLLKQLTASLISPQDDIGKKFWKRIYEEAARKFGTTNVPVNTFNKVWILPEKAVVYENAGAGTAYVVESKLKVMLEEDYLSLKENAGVLGKIDKSHAWASQVVREVVISQLTNEINIGANFFHLRQVYNSLILATWYKKKIKDSILGQIYTDKNKISGVNIKDALEKQKIYEQYLQAFKKGVYNYIREETDPLTQRPIPRKYFSGGMNIAPDATMAYTRDGAMIGEPKDLMLLEAEVLSMPLNRAARKPARPATAMTLLREPPRSLPHTFTAVDGAMTAQEESSKGLGSSSQSTDNSFKKILSYAFNFLMATDIGSGMPEVNSREMNSWGWTIYNARRWLADTPVVAQLVALGRAVITGVVLRSIFACKGAIESVMRRQAYAPNDVRFYNSTGQPELDGAAHPIIPKAQEWTFFGGSGLTRPSGPLEKLRTGVLSEFRAAIGGVLGVPYNELPPGDLNPLLEQMKLAPAHAYVYYHSNGTRSQNMGRLAKAYIVENVMPGYYDREALRFVEEVFLDDIVDHHLQRDGRGRLMRRYDFSIRNFLPWRWKMLNPVDVKGRLTLEELSRRLRRTWVAQSYGGTFTKMVNSALVDYLRLAGYKDWEINKALLSVMILRMSAAAPIAAGNGLLEFSVIYVEDIKDYIVFQRKTAGIYPDRRQNRAFQMGGNAHALNLGHQRVMIWMDNTWEQTWPFKPLPQPNYGVHDIRLTAANIPAGVRAVVQDSIRLGNAFVFEFGSANSLTNEARVLPQGVKEYWRKRSVPWQSTKERYPVEHDYLTAWASQIVGRVRTFAAAPQEFSRRGMTLTELAFGTGDLFMELIKIDGIKKAVAVDINPGAKEMLEQKLKGIDTKAETDVITADINVPESRDQIPMSDIIVVNNALMHMSHLERVLDTIAGRLSEGGLFIGNVVSEEMARQQRPIAMPLLSAANRRVYPMLEKLGMGSAVDKFVQWKFLPIRMSAQTFDEIEGLLKTRFDVEQLDATSWGHYQFVVRGKRKVAKTLGAADSAMPGGIDLTPTDVALHSGPPPSGIQFHIDPAMLKQLQDTAGFTPVIINIQPMADIRLFLGIRKSA